MRTSQSEPERAERHKEGCVNREVGVDVTYLQAREHQRLGVSPRSKEEAWVISPSECPEGISPRTTGFLTSALLDCERTQFQSFKVSSLWK